MWRIAWRFFTGLHLDGKMRSNGHGSVLPRYSSYFWNRYSRKQRALIRNLIFWLILLTGYGLLTDYRLTVYALLAAAPFLLFKIAHKVVDMVTQVVGYQDSDGVVEKYRIVRPKVTGWIQRHKPAKVRVTLPDKGPVPPEIARAILAENAEDRGEPIVNMRIAKEIGKGENGRGKPKGRNPYRRTR